MHNCMSIRYLSCQTNVTVIQSCAWLPDVPLLVMIIPYTRYGDGTLFNSHTYENADFKHLECKLLQRQRCEKSFLHANKSSAETKMLVSMFQVQEAVILRPIHMLRLSVKVRSMSNIR